MGGMTYNPRRLARAVREHRNALKLTQAELAERAGVAFETISRVESGREPPSLRTAVAIADALGATLDAIVGRSLAEPPIAKQSAESRRIVEAVAKVAPNMVRHILPLLKALATNRREAKTPRDRRRPGNE